jgi:PBP1b-binding outer membrane lipoprotein LpoB
MNMKKFQGIGIVILLLVYLSGCSDNKESKEINASKSEIVTEPEQVAVELEEEVSNEPTQAPVELQINEMQDTMFNTGGVVPVAEITSITDLVTVEDVIGNRGNCQMTAYAKSKLPKELKYGEKISIGFPLGCNLREIDVVTDQGSWTFNKQ